MDKRSIVSEVGKRINDVVSGRRSQESDIGKRVNDVVSGRRSQESGIMKRRQSDGFKDAKSSDWIFGAFFLVLIIFALSPGVLLTIPPGRGGLFMSCTTSRLAAFVHAVLLVALLNFL